MYNKYNGMENIMCNIYDIVTSIYHNFFPAF